MRKINSILLMIAILPAITFADGNVKTIPMPKPAAVTVQSQTNENDSPAALLGANQQPAAQSGGKPSMSPVEQLDELRTQEMILKEQLNVVKLQEQIAEARGQSPQQAGSGGRDPARVVMLPSVKSMGGVNGKYTAVVVYPDGSTLTVKQGGTLSDGSRVIHIGPDGVVVVTAIGIRTLPMATAPTANSSQPGGAVAPLQAPPIQHFPTSSDSAQSNPNGN